LSSDFQVLPEKIFKVPGKTSSEAAGYSCLNKWPGNAGLIFVSP
jgi:hypothetical protein